MLGPHETLNLTHNVLSRVCQIFDKLDAPTIYASPPKSANSASTREIPIDESRTFL